MLAEARSSIPSRSIALIVMLSLALAATPLALLVAQLKPRQLIAAVVALFLLAAIWVRPRLVFLFGYVVSITYNRQYYTFDWLHGELGVRGLYWCPSDLFLLLLLITWTVEAMHRRQATVSSPSCAAWLLPLICIAVISAVSSQEPVGSATEVIRLLKLALLLGYLRYNLDWAASWTVVAAFAAVILMQTLVAVLQAALGTATQGIAAITGDRQLDELARRASGTLGHPNFLAPYLLLLVPGFAAVALGSRTKSISLTAALVTVAGCATIILTESRAPIALAGFALPLVTCLLVAKSKLSPLRAVALMIAACATLVVIAIPIADRITKRLSGDLTQSVEMRSEYNRAALAIWETAPFFGVGPNNFILNIGRHAPQFAVVTDMLTESGHMNNMRAMAPVHNVYLLILSEYGLFGLIAFALFLGRALLLSWRAAFGNSGLAGLFASGIFCGFIAQLLQQMVDFSFWWDPALFTFAVLVAWCAHYNHDRELQPAV